MHCVLPTPYKMRTENLIITYYMKYDFATLRILKNIEKELILFPFDALKVEKESKKMDWKKIKNGFDPFAEISTFTMEIVK